MKPSDVQAVKQYALPSFLFGVLGAPIVITLMLHACNHESIPSSVADSAWCKWHSPLTKERYERGSTYFFSYFPPMSLLYLALKVKAARDKLKERLLETFILPF